MPAEDIAEFNNGTRNAPFEGFEGGWGDNEDYLLAFPYTHLLPGSFDLSPAKFCEDFEWLWLAPQSGPPYYGPPYAGQSVDEFNAENFSAFFIDGFESLWDSNETYQQGFPSFGSGSLSAGTFLPSAVGYEDFEADWQNNDDGDTGFYPGGSGVGVLYQGLFSGTGSSYDSFESGWTTTLP